jgi:thioredoxin reductase
MVAGVKCQQISERGVVIINQEQREETIASDSVVLAVGAKANVELLKSIQGAIPEIYAVGDCVEPRRIINAVSDGHRIGLFI